MPGGGDAFSWQQSCCRIRGGLRPEGCACLLAQGAGVLHLFPRTHGWRTGTPYPPHEVHRAAVHSRPFFSNQPLPACAPFSLPCAVGLLINGMLVVQIIMYRKNTAAALKAQKDKQAAETTGKKKQ